MAGGFPDAVHAGNQNHQRIFVRRNFVVNAFDHNLLQKLFGAVGVGNLFAVNAIFKFLDYFVGCHDAEVGGYKRVLQIVVKLIVQLSAGKHRKQLFADGVLRFFEAFFDF